MIETRNLNIVFNQGTALENHAVRGIDLRVDEGDFVLLIGANGSGKSSLLRLLSGEFQPTAGKIFLDNSDVTNMPRHRRARFIGQVFQDPLEGTCAELSIEENMALAIKRQGSRRLGLAVTKRRREQFAESLSILGIGLEDRLSDQVGLLSGGQRQALSLVMCTLTPSKVLLLDEHTAALDPRMSEFVLELTTKLYELHKLTVVMVTHSLHDALHMGNRTVLLHQGKVEKEISGSERDAYGTEKLLNIFTSLHAQITTSAIT